MGIKRARGSGTSRRGRKAISPDSGLLDGNWQGHFPVTCVALMSLLERLDEADADFSPAERILYVACEFWCALNAGELESYFDLKADDPTRDARLALRVVGAVKLSQVLRRGVLGVTVGRAGINRRQRLAQVEQRLLEIVEPVDLLLARFAWRYLSTQRRSADVPFRTPATVAVAHYPTSSTDQFAPTTARV